MYKSRIIIDFPSYSLDINGVITNLNTGITIRYFVDSYKNVKVRLRKKVNINGDIKDISKIYRILDLLVEYFIPKPSVDETINYYLKFIDNNTTSVRVSNLYWEPHYTNVIPVSERNEFVEIKSSILAKYYLINKDGVLVNSLTWLPLSWHIDKDGYKTYSVQNINKVTRSIGLHRLLAIAFIPTSGDVSQLNVNHINGIKTDNRLENLEWVSVQGNVNHGYDNGLYNSNIFIIIRNHITNNIVKLRSYGDTARYLRSNIDRVSNADKNNIKYPTIAIKDNTSSKIFINVKNTANFFNVSTNKIKNTIANKTTIDEYIISYLK